MQFRIKVLSFANCDLVLDSALHVVEIISGTKRDEEVRAAAPTLSGKMVVDFFCRRKTA